MAIMCKKGHVHSTQQAADKCYICLRKQAKKSAKRAKREQTEEIAALLSGKTEAANTEGENHVNRPTRKGA